MTTDDEGDIVALTEVDALAIKDRVRPELVYSTIDVATLE